MLSSINKNVKFFLASNSFYYGGFDIIGAFLAILITENVTGGSAGVVGYLLAYSMVIRSVLELIISPRTKTLSWKHKTIIISLGYVVYGVAVAGLGFSQNMFQVFAIQTVMALIDALCYPLKWSIFTKILDKDNQEFEWGLEDIISTLTSALFAALAGIIISEWNISILFVFFGVSYFFSGITFYFIKMKRNSISLKVKS